MVAPVIGQLDREQAKALIEQQGLRFEENFDAQFGAFEDGRLVATASRDRNVFKMFAITPEYQGGSVLGELISALLQNGHQAGYKSFFVFTPPTSSASFQACNFRPLVTHHKACLLEFGNGLKQYLNSRKTLVRPGHNGAVVVNCNPFTLGHQYLIESAAARVDHLYIFVVREDRSFFPFDVRYRLVEEGVAHLDNVTILDSGDYAVSGVTFPSYFLKADDDLQSLQMELDLLLFAKHLAPFFNISTRFIGTEPYCRTTRTYSEFMQTMLPPFGMEAVQLERCQAEGGVISAFRVRQALRKEAYETVRQLVPETTFRFLRSEDGLELQKKLVNYQRRH
ncbi:[citrate (pro-3S)-lyase] ligase [Malonomonas rubra DSM 5091]|uniref:[Citrate [pro-3S]-lyase] ligase n=1 Tax=Malonomonas rubra DSM 5091 TaxID=1122189 RepID=A0A1M6G753_MALRU|nr:adenylyltransferase/cytidyltransferase family protein [Malonomonas rubra]SHJ05818.1 [citrate (pro-3S)-lyase] ligase [Malonomonas rubra DSM 5091]